LCICININSFFEMQIKEILNFPYFSQNMRILEVMVGISFGLIMAAKEGAFG
jgi:hypothetical protein